MYDVFDENGAQVAVVHAYVGPQEQILASGFYDPKALLIDRVMFWYAPPDLPYPHG